MPPRRPPRRGKSHGRPGTPALAEVALKDLRRAHALMERGEHANAAVLFERQARDAGDRGLFLPAAHLYLQAGRARLLAGDTEAGKRHLYQGLRVLADGGDLHRLARSGSLLEIDLAQMGYARLAEEIKEFLVQELRNFSGTVPIPETTPSALLFQCSKCGAVLRNDDIEPGESRKPVCVYCGSLVNA
jgi:hypothetical protein